jgi:hexosaminidase
MNHLAGFAAGLALGVGTLGAPPAHAAAAAQALMPAPRTSSLSGEGALTGAFAADLDGCRDPHVLAAVERFNHDVAALLGVFPSGGPTPLRIRCAPDPAAGTVDQRESYRLTTASNGVEIDADGPVAVLRALATLRQLLRADGPAPALAVAHIDDAPRFAWRGLMVDTSRHFMSLAALKRQVDAMELTKLNVLHLSLNNDQGFRVESRRYPKLNTVGSNGQYYTQAELRDLVRYAADRGVRIIPEIDLPGHSLAILTSYPELGTQVLDPKDPQAAFKAALDPTSDKTYAFLGGLFDELTSIFPDAYFHVGGDEVTPKAWQGSAKVEQFKAEHHLASNRELEAYFHTRIHAMLAKRHRQMIGWEEVAESPLPKDVVVQVWRTSNPTSTATAAGNRVIVSAGYYLDLLRPAEYHYGVDPLDPTAFTTMSPEAFAKTSKGPGASAYVNEHLVAKPMPPLSAEQSKLVLGGEGALWAEIVTDEMLDGRLWPRAAVLGERLWSPATTGDAADMLQGLAPTMSELRALGLQDQFNRERMVARLAPDNPGPVNVLVGAVAPVRNYAHMRAILMGGEGRPLIELADAASTDSPEALSFANEVSRYLAGDHSRAPLIRAQLEVWRDNDPAFAAAAAGRPRLEAALPTSHNLAELGRAGLAALDALEAGQPLAPQAADPAEKVVALLAKQEAASKDVLAVASNPQPPADLIVRVAPDVGRLVAAAKQPR